MTDLGKHLEAKFFEEKKNSIEELWANLKFTKFPKNIKYNKSNKSNKWIYILLLVLVGLGVGGYFFVKQYNTKKNTKE